MCTGLSNRSLEGENAMYRIALITVLVLAVGVGSASAAGLMDRLNKAADIADKTMEKDSKKQGGNAQAPQRIGQEKKPSSSSEQSSTSPADKLKSAASSSSGGHPGRKQHDQYPPGISHSSLLNGVILQSKNGQFQLNHIQATFVPDDVSEGYAIIRTADGEEVYRMDCKMDKTIPKPYCLLDFWKTTDLRSGENLGAGGVDLSTPGDYVLDFYLPDEHYFTFPFSVIKHANDDPFAGGDRYVLGGDWERWAYLYYPEADPEKSLYWKVWLSTQSVDANRDVKPKIEITRGGAVVCVSRDITLGLKPEWVRYELDMIFQKEGTSGGAYFKAKDLLNTDGDYTLKMSLDENLYGTWKFTISDGKLQYKGRAVRGEADALTFVEGGRDAFWYEMEKKK